jgi:hypothetical protein
MAVILGARCSRYWYWTARRRLPAAAGALRLAGFPDVLAGMLTYRPHFGLDNPFDYFRILSLTWEPPYGIEP